MNIFSIKVKSAKNTNIFLVDIGQDEPIKMHSDAIVKFGLSVGEIDEEKFANALSESEQIIAFEMVVKYLAASMKTKKQIKDYLYKKGFKTPDINAVLEKAETYHLIDDKNFAVNYIKSNPSFSKNKLKQKLYGFGVDKNLCASILDNVDEKEGCQKSANKFMKNKPKTNEIKQKLMRHLASKGYNWATISEVVGEMNFGFDDEYFD